LTISSKDKF